MARRVYLGMFLLVALVALQGCVTKGKYNALLARNQQLTGNLDDYRANTAGLQAERDRLNRALAQKDQALALAEIDTSYWKNEAAALEEAYEELRLAEGVTTRDILIRLEALAKKWELEFLPPGVLRFPGDVLFDSGKVDIKSRGEAALKDVAELFKKEGKELFLRIDGHTDTDPIKVSPWADNWQLSAERARNVLLFLKNEGIDEDRMFFAGFAYTRPIADNATSAGKARNRRVEIIIVPEPIVMPASIAPAEEETASPGVLSPPK